MKKTIIATVCALFLGGAVQAEAPEASLREPDIKATVIELPNEPCAGNCPVKINYKYEPGKFVPNQLSILTSGKKPSLSLLKTTATSTTVSLGAGKYDIAVTYCIPDSRFVYQDVQQNIYHPYYIVVKEGVEISGDTELTFDVAEATNFVEFQAVTPDGKPYQHPVSRKKADGTRELDYTEANIYFETLANMIYHQDYGEFMAVTQATSHMVDDGSGIPNSFNYYINNVSDKYRSTLLRLAISDKNDAYMVVLEAKGTPGQPIKNTVFNKIEEKFLHTPSQEFYTRENGSRFDVWAYAKNYYLITLNGYQKEANPVIYYSNSGGEDIANSDFRLQIQLKSFEKDEPIADSNQRNQLAITGPILNITQKGISYENLQNNFFTFPRDNFSGTMGDNVPLTMMVMHSVDVNGNRSVQYQPFVFGRYGEQIQSSTTTLEAKISLDGKNVFTAPIAAVNNWAVTFAGDGHQKGKVTGEFINRNVKVDGIPGMSTLTVNYDENRNDVCAPTAQMLMFVDAQGMPRSKFSATDRIDVRIAGGDTNGNGRTYSYMDARTINVAYAPYATDKYTDLPLSLVRGATSSQNMAVYGATLPAISEKSSNGWYDVKISLSDNEGNTSKQTISPAFYIEGNAGISDIAASQEQALSYRDGMLFVADGAKVEIYGLDGRKVMEAASPVVTLEALPSGLYIARTASDTLKILK